MAEPPSYFVCPITQELMRDPVICEDTHSYERRAIREWFKKHNNSPLTGETIVNQTLITNFSLRRAIQDWKTAKNVVDDAVDEIDLSEEEDDEEEEVVHQGTRNEPERQPAPTYLPFFDIDLTTERFVLFLERLERPPPSRVYLDDDMFTLEPPPYDPGSVDHTTIVHEMLDGSIVTFNIPKQNWISVIFFNDDGVPLETMRKFQRLAYAEIFKGAHFDTQTLDLVYSNGILEPKDSGAYVQFVKALMFEDIYN